MPEDQLLTPEEVAERLQISPHTLMSWLRTGKLSGVKLGKFWRVRASDLEAFLHARQRESQALAYEGEAGIKPGPQEEAANPPDGDGAQASAALMALIRALFPEGQPIAPRPVYGLIAFPLHTINLFLNQHGLVLHATRTRRREHRVACTDRYGQVEFYGVFELRRTSGSTRSSPRPHDSTDPPPLGGRGDPLSGNTCCLHDEKWSLNPGKSGR